MPTASIASIAAPDAAYATWTLPYSRTHLVAAGAWQTLCGIRSPLPIPGVAGWEVQWQRAAESYLGTVLDRRCQACQAALAHQQPHQQPEAA